MLQKPSKTSRLAEHTMAHLKTWNILVKTFHIPEENLKCFENSNSDDFFPFLPYSMNKKRRWEVDFLEDLAEIQKLEDFEIFFLERTRKGAYDFPKYLESTMSEQFRIRVVHRISSNSENYEKEENNSIFGQDFKNFEASKTENSGIIAYNFIKSPENFMKIFGKKCISEKDNAWPYTSGWIRVRRQKNLKKELKFFEIQEENFECSEFENLEPEEPRNQKFYNLEEHFVENRRKRRKNSDGYRLNVNDLFNSPSKPQVVHNPVEYDNPTIQGYGPEENYEYIPEFSESDSFFKKYWSRLLAALFLASLVAVPIIVFLVVPSIFHHPESDPPVYYCPNKTCYQIMLNPKTWLDARTSCSKNSNSSLISINSEDTVNVQKLMTKFNLTRIWSSYHFIFQLVQLDACMFLDGSTLNWVSTDCSDNITYFCEKPQLSTEQPTTNVISNV